MSAQRASSVDAPSLALDQVGLALDVMETVESVERKLTRVRRVLAHSGMGDEDCGREALFRFAAEQMVQSGSPKTSPIVSVVNHVGNYWRNWLLLILRTGAYRPSTIARLLGALDPTRHISQRILTINLRMLERDGLIAREVIDDKRLNVVYALTPLGDDLSDQLLLLLEWGSQHAAAIAAARAAFDTSHSGDSCDSD
jgi:DNA-binding HxlR family transcriptional regulator